MATGGRAGFEMARWVRESFLVAKRVGRALLSSLRLKLEGSFRNEGERDGSGKGGLKGRLDGNIVILKMMITINDVRMICWKRKKDNSKESESVNCLWTKSCRVAPGKHQMIIGLSYGERFPNP